MFFLLSTLHPNWTKIKIFHVELSLRDDKDPDPLGQDTYLFVVPDPYTNLTGDENEINEIISKTRRQY
jgi:hypothetical protein